MLVLAHLDFTICVILYKLFQFLFIETIKLWFESFHLVTNLDQSSTRDLEKHTDTRERVDIAHHDIDHSNRYAAVLASAVQKLLQDEQVLQVVLGSGVV